jgi:hypothetical protein
MDDSWSRQLPAPVRVLPHINRLDDCFGDFLVRVACECACRVPRFQGRDVIARYRTPKKNL